jgi:hypothetical protein
MEGVAKVRGQGRRRQVANTHSVEVEDHDAGIQTKTFINAEKNVDLIVISDGAATIVAIPKVAGRPDRLAAQDLSCLAKCRRIENDQERIQCIVKCPSNASWDVFVSASELRL